MVTKFRDAQTYLVHICGPAPHNPSRYPGFYRVVAGSNQTGEEAAAQMKRYGCNPYLPDHHLIPADQLDRDRCEWATFYTNYSADPVE